MWSKQPAPYLDDEIGHFLIARDAWRHPELIFSFWGRPICTLFYMPGALFGLTASRLLSFLASTLVVFYVLNIARILGSPKLWLVLVLLETQPWFFNNTHDVLTEIPAMLFMTAGLYYWLNGRICVVSFLVGLLPLVRHEFIILSGLWGVWLLLNRNWKAAVICALPLVLINITSVIVYGTLVSKNFFRPKGTAIYGQGGWLHYVFELSTNRHVGVPILAFSLLGLWSARSDYRKIFVVLPFLVHFIVNTVVYRYGLFSSGGFGIFILPCAPIIALSAGWGIESVQLILSSKTKTVHVGNIVLLLVFIWVSFVAVSGFSFRNYHGEATSIRKIVDYIKENNLSTRRIAASNPWFYALMPRDIPVENGAWYSTLWSRNYIDKLEPGDLLLWDVHYSDRWGHKYAILDNPDNWTQLTSIATADKVIVVLFERK